LPADLGRANGRLLADALGGVEQGAKATNSNPVLKRLAAVDAVSVVGDRLRTPPKSLML
jgi:hypothetical protein